MKETKLIGSLARTAFKRAKTYSTAPASTLFAHPASLPVSNSLTFIKQTQDRLNEIKDFPQEAQALIGVKLLNDYLADIHQAILQLVEQKKFSTALKACEACLEPYESGELAVPTDEVKNLYRLYIHIKNTGAGAIEHYELLKTLDRAIALFPEDMTFKEKKQSIEGGMEINRLINQGRIKTY